MAKLNYVTTQRTRGFLAIVGFLLLGVQNHHGQFLEGRTLTMRLLSGGMEVPGHTVSFTVDSIPGHNEVTNWGGTGFFSIDVFDTDETNASIIIRCYANVGFGNLIWQFADLDRSLPDFGVLRVDSTHWGWMYQERFTVSSDTIDISTFYLYGYPNAFVRLDITREVPPRLAIESVGSSRVAISWPTNASHYTLESASSLLTSDWNTVTNESAIVGQRFTLAFDATNTRRFFRLHKR